MKHTFALLTVLLLAASANADDGKPPSRYTGLSVFANAGTIWADPNTAEFYSGRPDNPNTIERVLHSQTYGTQIWQDLTNAGLISSAISHYSQLKVVEYPEMYYKMSFLYGMGIRYDYSSGFGWLVRFDLSRLQAVGAFNLDAGAGLIGFDQYVTCGIMGQEDRINIDFALAQSFELDNAFDLELNLGASLTNTKVRENMMEIAGRTYSILDVWNGHSPDYGTVDYDYINQGGIGYGVFISALVGYRITGVGAIRVGYTCAQSKIVLEKHTAWGWQHSLGVRFEINNFNVFGSN